MRYSRVQEGRIKATAIAAAMRYLTGLSNRPALPAGGSGDVAGDVAGDHKDVKLVK